MEALFEASKDAVRGMLAEALKTEVYQQECLKLARFTSKVALVLAEVELVMRTDEDLRGSKSLFVALEALVAALQQGEQLVQQCSRTAAGSVWPLEDAVEFQAAGLELLNAVAGLSKLQASLGLPQDIREDLAHIQGQLDRLSFTEVELSETEEVEMTKVQQGELPASTHAAAAAAASAQAAALQGVKTAPDAEAAGSGNGMPPPAPPEQFRASEGEGQGQEEREAAMRVTAERLAAGVAPSGLPPRPPTLLGVPQPTSPALQALGEAEQLAPLPKDPFGMGSRAGSAQAQQTETLLQTLKLAGVGDELDPDTERQLEGSADNLSLAEQQRLQQQGGAISISTEGWEAGPAAAGGGGQAAPESGAAKAGGLSLSPSAQATQEMMHNLAELATAGKPESAGSDAATSAAGTAEP